MRKILVLRGGALGDFLVTLPALKLLRRHWPKAIIELVGNARAAELGLRDGGLDAVHSQHEARWSALHSDQSLSAELYTWLADFDLVVNYWPDANGAISRHFPLRPEQHFLGTSAQPTLKPAARHYCEPLHALGLSADDFRPDLDGFSRVAKENLIAIHPGSGSPRKNWPKENWLELIRQLPSPVLLVLGEAEADWASLLSTLPAKVKRAQNLPLPELATRLAGCRMFLGHDSGVSHLAAAVGTPCALLFGPTDPAMWAPPGDHVRVLRCGESLDAISVDEVLAAIAALQVAGA